MTTSAVIIGASGGIGGAIADALEDEGTFAQLYRFARSAGGANHLDLSVEASIAAAAASVTIPPTRIIVATGLLHDDGHQPEKALAQLDPAALARQFAVNAIGPALVAKHFLPLIPRTGGVFAALSARVGSIGDNRLGGWYGYRASKAALNQFIRTAAIETRRTNDRAIVVALHPGTVDTALSRPFQGNVAPGRLFDTERAALQLLDVIDGLGVKDSGRHFDWQGAEITP